MVKRCHKIIIAVTVVVMCANSYHRGRGFKSFTSRNMDNMGVKSNGKPHNKNPLPWENWKHCLWFLLSLNYGRLSILVDPSACDY